MSYSWSLITINDEIMGFKEEFREEGYSEGDIAEAVRAIEEAYRAEGRPPNLERIKEEHTAKRKNPSIVIGVL